MRPNIQQKSPSHQFADFGGRAHSINLQSGVNIKASRASGKALLTLAEYCNDASSRYTETDNGLIVIPANDLQRISFPKRKNLFAPWLKEKTLNMVFAARGVGKTHFALGVATALATGKPFLGWQVSEPVKVLYLDGEMCSDEIVSRMKALGEDAFTPNLSFLSPDFSIGAPVPDLATEDGRKQLEAIIESEQPQVVIIDNKSCFMRKTRENEGDAWAPMQDFLIDLKREGMAVLLIHHAGKDGAQRGSSRIEDAMEAVIQLKRPDGYSPEDGAHFELHFTKARGFYGQDAQSMEVKLGQDPQGNSEWHFSPLNDKFTQAVDMLNDGMKATDIAEALDVHKGTISKWKKKAISDGLIQEK